MKNFLRKPKHAGKEGGILRFLQILIQVVIATGVCNKAGLGWLQSENIFSLHHLSSSVSLSGLLVYLGDPMPLTSLPSMSFEQFEKLDESKHTKTHRPIGSPCHRKAGCRT